MRLVTDLTETQGIHCQTEEEAKAICKLMHDAGLTWMSGGSYLDNTKYKQHVGDTVYFPAEGLKDSLKICIQENWEVFNASDFLPNGVTLEEIKEMVIQTQKSIEELSLKVDKYTNEIFGKIENK